jgi:hypothetical protein
MVVQKVAKLAVKMAGRSVALKAALMARKTVEL